MRTLRVLLCLCLFAVTVGCGDDIGEELVSVLDADNDGGQGGDGGVLDDALADVGTGTVEQDAIAGDGSEGADVAADAEPQDAGPQLCQGVGEFGCPCEKNDDCDSTFCLEAQDGKVCSKTCLEACPVGFACETVGGGGGDVVSLCVPQHARVCAPCKADADCNGPQSQGDSLCIAYKAGANLAGKFCGSACTDDAGCPNGYACQESEGTGGSKAKQCVLVDAICSCGKVAIAQQLATVCETSNGVGSCLGERACGDSGLSACSAPTAVTEVCNSVDDDCDGATDSPTTGLCDDNNPCTFDTCTVGNCTHNAAEAACDDSDACTQKDQCSKSVCGGDAIVCDDGDVCTDDTCDTANGCQTANNADPCDDGDVCHFDDACKDGKCLPGTATVCDDDNVCTDDACDAKAGCQTVVNVATCDDGSKCSTSDACAGGKCVGDIVTCDDANPCTDDVCLPASGCTATDNNSDCDDGSVCSYDDGCINGVCLPGAVTVCDDKNLCTDDFCDPKGGCGATPNVLPCDDGDPCSIGDRCAAASCAGKGTLNCNDENPCTDDGCSEKSSDGCTHTGNVIKCTDNNECTVDDRCKDTLCLPGPAPKCDDGNPCTTDHCDTKKGCVTSLNSLGCDDGSACTAGDTCKNGLCLATKKVDCNDENLCTTDSCTDKGGCEHSNNSQACTDNNACTAGDICTVGACKPGNQIQCDDNNPCTTDGCEPGGAGKKPGCFAINNTLPCDDGTVCSTNDRCKTGKCVGGSKLACTDGNVCTDDGCHPKKACVFTNNSAKCSDENACTTGDACKKGVCTPDAPSKCDDGNVCTTESCDVKNGCNKTNNTAPCSDGSVCTVSDKCGGGTCKAGAKQGCNDGNPCTNDSCAAKKGCQHAANKASCSDGNACTVKDACAGSKCVPGAPPKCDDGNVCTTNLCHPASGCLKVGNTAPCSDGSVCTVGDTCSKGQCLAGKKASCNDGNVCTNDSCKAKTGCVYAANSAACTDNNKCTVKDTCKASKCVPGAAAKCDDGNVCTTNLCIPTAGCLKLLNAAPCSDGSVCTVGDTCSKGKCAAGNKVKCDDGNLCTNDSCSAKVGCVHANNTAPCNDGNGCTDKDVCSSGKCKAGAGCASVALCVPGKTTPTCKCNAGYTGNGFVCNDINECKTNNGGCHKDANCTNKPGTLSCACKPGFSGDGKACVRRLVRDDLDNTKLLDAAKTKAIKVSGGAAQLQAGGIHFGDGKDGNRTVSSNTNLHTQSISGRKRADAEQWPVSKLGSKTITIGGTGTDGTKSNKIQESVSAGDEVLVINMHAPGAKTTNVGRWELCDVVSASSSTITCADAFKVTFGPTSNSSLSGQKVVVARVPNYANLVINSSRTLTGNGFGGSTGGLLALRASGTMTVNGSINMDYKGFRGGIKVRSKKTWGGGYRGESPSILYSNSGSYTQHHGGGGGGNAEWCHSGQGGAGGGYGSGGRNGYAAYHQCGGEWRYAKTHAHGGTTFGDANLTRVYMGPGGGSGGVDGDNPDNGGQGGNGGGIIIIFADKLTVKGSVVARGQQGYKGDSETGGGGSGAGGSILIGTQTASLGSGKLVATGGPDSTAGRHENRGGYGGSGRIAVRYTSSASGASSPGFHKSKHVEFSKTGTVVSKDLVAGKSAIGFYSFAYSLSGLPSGTGVKVQFSQNTSNWYSAAGKLNLANAMSAGGTKTLLLTMGWKKGPFYYRATLTGDASTTPKLSHVELNYVTK
jgi:hypothetical protein